MRAKPSMKQYAKQHEAQRIKKMQARENPPATADSQAQGEVMAKSSTRVIAGKSPNKASRAVSVPDSQYASVSVRKIDNGFIISESCEGPKGYTHKERFSPTKPKITMPIADAPKGKK